jgi:hypothetical protein
MNKMSERENGKLELPKEWKDLPLEERYRKLLIRYNGLVEVVNQLQRDKQALSESIASMVAAKQAADQALAINKQLMKQNLTEANEVKQRYLRENQLLQDKIRNLTGEG